MRTIEETVPSPYLVMDGMRMVPDFEELGAQKYSCLAVGSMVKIPEQVS